MNVNVSCNTNYKVAVCQKYTYNHLSISYSTVTFGCEYYYYDVTSNVHCIHCNIVVCYSLLFIPLVCGTEKTQQMQVRLYSTGSPGKAVQGSARRLF